MLAEPTAQSARMSHQYRREARKTARTDSADDGWTSPPDDSNRWAGTATGREAGIRAGTDDRW